MTAASCKFNSGQIVSTRCFPARTSLHQRAEGAGHWLDAYRQEQKKLRNVHRKRKGTSKKCRGDREAPFLHGNVLNGPFLLQSHSVDEPSELCSVDISEKNLTSVKPEDLKVFYNVAYIDASVNSLTLECFSSFVSLRELSLSLNGLCSVMCHAADFPHLEVLDLSYNSLSADSIVSIGGLPRLKVLRLTGNQLHHLPPNMGCSNHDASQLTDQEETADTQFKALEVLELDENKLTSEVFTSLQNLRRLKHLNLQGNLISEIPYLQLTDSWKHLQTFIGEKDEGEGLASDEPKTDLHDRVSQRNWEEQWKRSSVPLPELQFLNLANNKIEEEGALMAVALFPMIREIDIRSNPLTIQRSGDPPLLTYSLRERLGILITWRETRGVVRQPLRVSADPKWKVEDRLQRVSKKSLLMVTPHPVQVEKKKKTVWSFPDSHSEGTKNENDASQETESFFLTQAADVPYEFDPGTAEKRSVDKRRKHKDDNILVKLTGYEMLRDANLNPDLVTPIGIQTAVRMLEHTLRNLNVSRDSKPKFDCIQIPSREIEKKMRQLPSCKTKQPADRIDEMMEKIRQSTTTREIPLSRAIQGKGADSKREALSLLRDMKTKYQMLHNKTMEQVANMQPQRNTAELKRRLLPGLSDGLEQLNDSIMKHEYASQSTQLADVECTSSQVE